MSEPNAAPAIKSASSSGEGPAVSGSGPSSPVRIVNGWVMVDGCKVARAEPGGVLAFHDRDRRRCSERGSDQPRCTVQELVKAVESAE
jgi:hypothetical protein